MKAFALLIITLFFSVNTFAQQADYKPLSKNPLLNKISLELYNTKHSYEDNTYKYETPAPPPTKSFMSFIGGGLSVPAVESDFGEFYNPGFNVTGGAGYRISPSQTIRFGVQYNNFPDDISIVDAALSITSLRGDFMLGRLMGGGPLNFYGFGGVGVSFLSAGSASETNLGFGVGAGMTFMVSPGGITLGFIEASLDYNTNDGYAKGYVPIKAGLIFIP